VGPHWSKLRVLKMSGYGGEAGRSCRENFAFEPVKRKTAYYREPTGMTRFFALCVLVMGMTCSVGAQTFSRRTIDTSLLPDLVPGHNSCLDRDALTTHACQPVAALLQSIVPPPTTERAVVSAADVLQLCGAHNIRDVVCGVATLLELRYQRVPCWQNNKC
jgi:hypothetical protein